MPTWNDQQLKAIQTKEKNILVSASAGSGKTTVLIARLMDLVLKDRIPIDAILAMTFTEAAANEMKKRLAFELQSTYAKTQDEKEKTYISKQLTAIQTAHISTIHSFCLSIIQDYYYMIGLEPQRIRNIMDNGTMAIYQGQALQEALQIQYEKQDTIFIALCEMFSSRPESDDALSSVIKQMATLASSKSDSEAWLQEVCDFYHNIQKMSDISQVILDNFYAYLEVEYERYQELLSQILELYQFRYGEEVKKKTIVEQKITALPPIIEALKQGDYEQFRLNFIASTYAVVPPCPDKEDKEYAGIRKQIQDLEDRMIALMHSEDCFIQDMKSLHPYVCKLVEICRDYRTKYAQIKQQQQCIDFDDMEHFALAILQVNQGSIAQLYREQFKEIMVDEFQDSNDVQNMLVTLICRENNVFRVGDIKQSIYGFRHAKPQLMRGLIEHRTPHDEVIYLSNNYRSKKMIVEFNNVLFKRLMNIDGFSCRYAKEDDVETGVPAQNEENVPICFHAIFHDEIKKENDLIIAKNDLKASYIASQIVEIKEKEQRSWKDFVVLVRSNARKNDMKSVFDELNIPYFIDVKSGFYQSEAVQIVLSTLRALSQPHNDISFVASMMSPLFELTPEDFAQAKLAKDKNQSYYQFFMEHPFPAFTKFCELRKQMNNTTLKEMLNALYNVNNYYSLYTSIQDKTNLDLLFDKACQFESQSASGIRAFLAQIEQIKDEQTAEAIPIGSEDDVVRVMSIHQSKGLQFPVVFLWSTDKMTPIEFKELCIQDADLGIALKYMELPERFIRTTIPRIAMEHKKDREELEEEMRILYVATTRAQQQMHIVDCLLTLDTYKRPLSMSAIYQRGGYTAWILQAFLQSDDPLFTLREVHTLWNTLPQAQEILPHKEIPLYSQTCEFVSLDSATNIKTLQEDHFSLHDRTQATDYGTHMHYLIEHLGQAEWTNVHMKEIASSINFAISEGDMARLWQLYHHPIFQETRSSDAYYELPFMVKDLDTILHGFIDFMAMNETHIWIIDFKTDALKDEIEFINRYQEQLHIYKKAMHILYPEKEIETYIYSLHLGNMILIR